MPPNLRPAVRRVDARGVHAGTFLARSSAAPVEASALACLRNNGASHTSAMPDMAQVHAVLAAYALLVSPPGRDLHGTRPRRRWPPKGRTSRRAATTTAATGSTCRWAGTGGERVKKGDLASAKAAYMQVKPMLGRTATDLTMWFFYPLNGPGRARVLAGGPSPYHSAASAPTSATGST